MSWFKPGGYAKSGEAAAKMQEQYDAKRSFWVIPYDPQLTPEQNDAKTARWVIPLDDDMAWSWMHCVEVGLEDNWTWVHCNLNVDDPAVKMGGDPLCERGLVPRYCMIITVLDCTPWIDNEGKKRYNPSKKWIVATTPTETNRFQVTRANPVCQGSLTHTLIKVVRTSKDAARIGDVWTPHSKLNPQQVGQYGQTQDIAPLDYLSIIPPRTRQQVEALPIRYRGKKGKGGAQGGFPMGGPPNFPGGGTPPPVFNPPPAGAPTQGMGGMPMPPPVPAQAATPPPVPVPPASAPAPVPTPAPPQASVPAPAPAAQPPAPPPPAGPPQGLTVPEGVPWHKG